MTKTKNWSHHAKYKTFTEADLARNELKKTANLWVKIRRRPDLTFDVITWEDKSGSKEK